MWIWFNRYGFLQEKLIHGPEARVGTTNFKIFAYFNGLDTDYYPQALIRFERPDLHGSEYPTMFMQKVTLTYEPVEGDTESINFRTNEQYTGYLFDFGNFTGEEDVVRLLDTPGLWRATVTLIGENREMNVAGLIKFNVEPAVSSVDDEQDPQDPDISYFIEQTAIELATKLEKDSNFYVREHYNFVQAAQDGELSKEIFQPGSVVYNRADSAMYMINTVTDNPNIEDGHYVFATYSILDYNDGRVGYLELDASSSGSILSQAEYEQVLKDICLIKCGNYWYYKFNYSQPGGSTELYVFGRFADFSSNSGTINIKRQSITINKNTRVWNLTTLLNYNFYDKNKVDSLITGVNNSITDLVGNGVGYVELTDNSNPLTADQLAQINRDYCIIKYGSALYYKDTYISDTMVTFSEIPVLNSNSNNVLIYKPWIQVNLSDGSWSLLNTLIQTYNKAQIDQLLANAGEIVDGTAWASSKTIKEIYDALPYNEGSLRTGLVNLSRIEINGVNYELGVCLVTGLNYYGNVYELYVIGANYRLVWNSTTSGVTATIADMTIQTLDQWKNSDLGYVSGLHGNGGTLTADQLVEAQKKYSIIDIEGTLYYKYNETSSSLWFKKAPTIPSSANNLIVYGNEDIFITKASGSWHIETTNYNIYTKTGVDNLVSGVTGALVYNDYSAMVTAFNSMADDAYNVGQNVYIRTLEVPDLWVSSVESTSSSYTYTTDAAFLADLATNGYVQVGFYKFNALETTKVIIPTDNIGVVYADGAVTEQGHITGYTFNSSYLPEFDKPICIVSAQSSLYISKNVLPLGTTGTVSRSFRAISTVTGSSGNSTGLFGFELTYSYNNTTLAYQQITMVDIAPKQDRLTEHDIEIRIATASEDWHYKLQLLSPYGATTDWTSFLSRLVNNKFCFITGEITENAQGDTFEVLGFRYSADNHKFYFYCAESSDNDQLRLLTFTETDYENATTHTFNDSVTYWS